MATNFPSSLDAAAQQPSPSATTDMDATGFEHHTVHTNHSGALIALETKMGIGASAATGASDGHVLTANGSGGSAWAAAAGGLPDGLSFGHTTGLLIEPNDVDQNPGSGRTHAAVVIKGMASESTYDGLNILFVDKSDNWMADIGMQGDNSLRLRNTGNFTYITTGSWVYIADGFYHRSSDIRPDGDNTLDIGTSGARCRDVYSAGGVTTSSDVNLKENIKDTTLGLDFVNDLRTVNFQWKPSNEFPKEWNDYSEENNMDTDVIMHGFIAQEVKEVLDKHSSERDSKFSGWKEGEDGMQHTSREMFVIPLIKAVQELSAQVDTLKEEIKELKNG